MSSDDQKESPGNPPPSVRVVGIKDAMKANARREGSSDDASSLSSSSEAEGSLDGNKLDSLFDADTDSLRLSKSKFHESKPKVDTSKDGGEGDDGDLSDEELKDD